ncbi:MAG: SDR family NAD(P)-dependent oxidoreductase [Candidatus Eisenbacteria bacterium]|nr:SDR family NAD(P)-dependent oxidoreductase [Candidatus Eisenbacteria bacterium]
MDTLAGRWALVTGSTRGIGQQIALGLAEFDCNVIVHGRRSAHAGETLHLLSEYAVETAVVAGDLATRAGVRSVIRGAEKRAPRIDILYNNAGIQNAWQPVWEIERPTWQETLDVNLFAMVELTNAFAPGMLERGYGRIVNTSSGIRDIPELAPYSVSKAAVDKYSTDLAAELEGTNVLVNALDPGWLSTDMGGPNADHDVTTVLPGALVPALLPDFGASGEKLLAQEYEWSD